jgi:hypothetical protein
MTHPFNPTILDHDPVLDGAKRMRDEALGRHLATLGLAAGRPFRASARAVGLSLGAAAVATGAFWAVMLTSPPRTQASVEPVETAAPAPAVACLVSPPCP